MQALPGLEAASAVPRLDREAGLEVGVRLNRDDTTIRERQRERAAARWHPRRREHAVAGRLVPARAVIPKQERLARFRDRHRGLRVGQPTVHAVGREHELLAGGDRARPRLKAPY